MKRRQRDTTGNAVPAKLARFNPEHWPGATDLERFDAWADAAEAWTLAHPDAEGWIELPQSVAWDPALDPP